MRLPVLPIALALIAAVPAGAAAPARPAAKRSAAPQKVARAFLPNYAAAPFVSSLTRWRRTPVRIWFDTGGAYTDERRLLAEAGFDLWTEATGGVISYRVVEQKSECDVVVRFDAAEFLDDNYGQVGRTWTGRRGAYLAQAQIALATAQTRPEELTEVAAHEWGHALGIAGHSDDSNDLMYATAIRIVTTDPRYTPRTRRPSERDINTIKTLYAPMFPG